MQDERRDVLYLMNNVSYGGGAHIATKRLIKALVDRGYSIDVLVQEEPTGNQREDWAWTNIYVINDRPGLFGRFVRRVLNHFHVPLLPDWILDPQRRMRKLMVKYRCVCVMSELSPYRLLVSHLPRDIRKVQLSHVDYGYWSRMNEDTRRRTSMDLKVFNGVDVFAVVGKSNAERLQSVYLKFAKKITWFDNIIPNPNVLPMRRERRSHSELVTVARLDSDQKDVLRMVRVAKRLKKAGVRFFWAIYGAGPKIDEARRDVVKSGCDDVIRIAGWTEKPFEKIANADMFVLLSHYEGLPNVIYESFMCGTPVFSTKVGAIADQIEDGKNGWLVHDKEEDICSRMISLLMNPKTIEEARYQLQGYYYNNEAVIQRHERILGLA